MNFRELLFYLHQYKEHLEEFSLAVLEMSVYGMILRNKASGL